MTVVRPTKLDVLERPHHDQLVLDLDWGSEPWHGVSPRYLCVDNSRSRLPKPRGALVDRRFTSAAQLLLWVYPHPSRRKDDGVQV